MAVSPGFWAGTDGGEIISEPPGFFLGAGNGACARVVQAILMGGVPTENSVNELEANGRFDLPEFDELTHRRLLPKSALHHGRYYVGRCRNASVARWNARQQCFYHWREKFGRIYIEKIKHPADEPRFDVFRVLEELANSECEIPFNLRAKFRGEPAVLTEFNERVWCSCQGGQKPCVVHFGGPKAGSDPPRRP
jgi:hypothetical protein